MSGIKQCLTDKGVISAVRPENPVLTDRTVDGDSAETTGKSSREIILDLCNIAMICSRDETKLTSSAGENTVLRHRGGFCSRDDLPE